MSGGTERRCHLFGVCIQHIYVNQTPNKHGVLSWRLLQVGTIQRGGTFFVCQKMGGGAEISK